MRTIKRSICMLIIAVLAVTMVLGGMSASAAKDTYDKYVEFKGGVGVISNCDGTGKTQSSDQNGSVDPLGEALPAEFSSITGTNPATPEQSRKVEGTATDPGCASEQVNYTTDNYLQGTSGVSIRVTPDQNFKDGQATKLYNTKTRFVIRQMTGIKVTDPQNTYLCFYMYLPGAASDWDSNVIDWDASGIEISEVSDVKEMYFSMKAINQHSINGVFKSGWNQIILPLNKLGNNAKAMQIKMFRFFLYGVQNSNKEVTVTFDNFSLETAASLKALGIQVPEIPVTSSKPTVSSKPAVSSKPVSSKPVSSKPVSSKPASSDTTSVDLQDSSTISSTVTSSESTSVIVSDVTSEDPSSEPVEDAVVDREEDDSGKDDGSMTWLWIVVGAVVVLGGGAAVIALVVSKKKLD